MCSPSFHLFITVYYVSVCMSSPVLLCSRHGCGFYMLEYFAKWEGRRVPVITAAMVVELRKIYTWNWLMNEDFNKRASTWEFIEEDVKSANKKYKWSRDGPYTCLPYILWLRNVRYHLVLWNYVRVLCYDCIPCSCIYCGGVYVSLDISNISVELNLFRCDKNYFHAHY